MFIRRIKGSYTVCLQRRTFLYNHIIVSKKRRRIFTRENVFMLPYHGIRLYKTERDTVSSYKQDLHAILLSHKNIGY